MEDLQLILSIINISIAIILSLAALIRPFREKIFGIKKINDGQKCLLRSDMLREYYHNMHEKKIRQYECENFVYEYKAYKALGGNSFIDKIYSEVQKWDVLT